MFHQNQKLHQKLQKASAFLLLCLGSASAASAVPVPIANAGFEADVLPVGGIGNTITGWDTSPGGGDGVYHPPLSDFPGGVPEGKNVAYANGPGNRVRQVLTTKLAPNTTYVLRVEVGWNNHDPFAGYRVQLRADGKILAEDNSSLTPAQGTFVTSTVQYTSGPGDPVGKPLEIYLTALGIQADFDDVRLTASFPTAGVCAETHLLPFYLVDTTSAVGTNTLYAVRNLTGTTVSADVAYYSVAGALQKAASLTLDPYETETVSIRNVPGLIVDGDGFARGFVKVSTVGGANGKPVLSGDFFQIDVANAFATGDKLVPAADICAHASIRFLEFGTPTRLTVYLTNPRGANTAIDPPSFTVQVLDLTGLPDVMSPSPQPVWTSDHALEIDSSDFTALPFGTLQLDFTNSLGGAAYAEYSAQGQFSVGVTAQCDDPRPCGANGCCPPGSPKATVGGLHYPIGQFPDCAAAIADAVSALGSFHYRNACEQAYGGPLPGAVLGAHVVSCAVNPPGSPGNVVVAAEVCCPLP